MRFEVRNASCGYGGAAILNDITLSVESGHILCLLGPNGVGKTTLFKSMLGFLKLLGGEILIDGENTSGWQARRLAQTVGYVPQVHTPPFPFTVLDVVAMGRIAHLGLFGTPGARDMQIAEENLEHLGISYLRDKIYTEISGGERQMVLIARALAQDPKILVMDEPKAVQDGKIYVTPTVPFNWFDRPPNIMRMIGMQWFAGVMYPEYVSYNINDRVKDFFQLFYNVQLTDDQVKALLAPNP